MVKWTDEDRELVALFADQGLGIQETADEMGITTSQVRYLRGSSRISTKGVYKHLYQGTEEEVKERLIKILQDAPIKTYTYFNSKDSGTPAATTYRKYFGSWSAALEAAGVVNYSNMQPTKPTTVYLVEFDGFYKVGITQQTVNQRLGKRYGNYTIIMQITTTLKEALEVEKRWLKNVKEFQYIPQDFPSEGRGFTECFKY